MELALGPELTLGFVDLSLFQGIFPDMTILEKAERQISTVGKSLGEASRKTRTRS